MATILSRTNVELAKKLFKTLSDRQKETPKTNVTSGYSFDPGNVTTQKTPSTVSGASVGMMTGGLSPYAIGTGLIPRTPQTTGQIGTPTTKMAQTQGGGTQGVGTQQSVAQPPLDLANEEKYLRGILKNEKADPALKNWAVQQAKQYGIDITQPTLEELREQAKTEREKFIESGLQSELTGLEAQRQRALGTLEQQRGLIAPQYEALRTQAATRAMQQARNFAEYMGARGALTGGAAAQAEIQRGAELQGRFGEIGLAEQQAIQNLENKKSDVQLDFDTKISQAKTQAERDKQEFELSQRLNEISRIENEMMQKIENARILEEEKIKAAAASAKDEADYQRKKELIQFQTNEDIRLAQQKALLVSPGDVEPKVTAKDSAILLQKATKNLLQEILNTDETGTISGFNSDAVNTIKENTGLDISTFDGMLNYLSLYKNEMTSQDFSKFVNAVLSNTFETPFNY